MDRRLITLIAFGLVVLCGWLFFDWGPYLRDPGLIRDTIALHKIWTPLIFFIVQLVAETLLLPGPPFTVAGGLLFGPILGVPLSISASVLAALFDFWMVRYGGRQSFWLHLHQRFALVRRYNLALQDDGFRHVFITHLLPFIPGNILGVAYGLTRVSVRDYFLGTLLGNLPTTILFSYFGNLIAVTDDLPYVVGGGVAIVAVSFIWYRFGGGRELIRRREVV